MTRAEHKALKVFGDLPNTPENQEKVVDWIDGYEQAEKDTIERAIEWLRNNLNVVDCVKTDYICRFRKAMEEQQ